MENRNKCIQPRNIYYGCCNGGVLILYRFQRMSVADFLDLSLNLSTESCYPFRKPNDQPLYIHHQSNHAPNTGIIRNLPASISCRLTDISSNEDFFADAKPLYDKALRESGFSAETEYLERRMEQGRANRRTRSRKVIWFNKGALKTYSTQPTIKERGEEAHVRSAVQGLPQ